MARPKTGIDPNTERSIQEAIARLAADPTLPRTRAHLATLAGVGRATIYRGFEHRPELQEAFARLVGEEPTPTKDDANERLVRELRKDNRDLRRLLDATATTVEHLLRENATLGALRSAQVVGPTTVGSDPSPA